MVALAVGLGALLFLMYGAKAFANADPRRLARWVKRSGGFLLLAAAGALLLGGRWGLALPIALAGLSLLGPQGFFGRQQSGAKAPGRRSEVRSPRLAMWLDHDTGAMGGRVLSGVFAQAPLETLRPEDLRVLFEECRTEPDSLSLLEAYLDRRLPGWREAFDEDARPGRAAPAREGAMTQEEAHQILGLAPGADDEAIRRAHRDLMKRLHPDGGGSVYLAARVNQARDLLIGKHRGPA